MAIKKNIDNKQSLNDNKNDFGINNLDGLSEDNITILDKEKIQLAQALDQESLNNIQSDASIDLIPPDDININNVGIPQEETNVESADNLTEELGGQSISPELFAGDANDGIPQQETNNESPVSEESIVTAPVEEIPEGSPAQGTANLDQSTSDINNIEFAPEESDFLGAPNEDNDLPITTEITADNNIEELAPEEVVLESNPAEGLSDVENILQDNNEGLAPEISETAGIPLEEVGEEQAFNQTITTDDQDIPPILSEIAGAPELELSDSNEIEVTGNIIAPTESFAEGNPLLADTEESIFNQEDSIVEIAEIGPEQSEILGQPVQISEEIVTESDIQLAEIAPEQSDPQGIPQEENIEIADSFEVADAEQIAPQEGNIQDYIETVFEEKLSEGIKKGLSSEEAAVAAIEAGREAVKESASTPEEINEFAENFNENIIDDINNKIEKIENDIQQIKEKSINDKTTEVAEVTEETVPQEETEVAEVTEETVPQEETAEVESEVAEVTEETVPQEETEVAEVTEETVPQEETAEVESEVAEVTEETVPQEETEVAEVTEETVPQEETEVAEVTEETVPQEETAEVESEVAEVTEETVPQEETAEVESEVAEVTEETVPQEETEVAEVTEETVPQEETEVAEVTEETVPQEETEVAQADAGSQILNNLNEDQALDSILSDTLSTNNETLNQIETLSSLSEEIEDVEASETDEAIEEESEDIIDDNEGDDSDTQVASIDSLSINNTSELNLENVDGLGVDSSLTGTAALLVSGNGISSNLLGGVSSLGNVNILGGTNVLSATSSLGIDPIGTTVLTSVLGDESSSLIDSIGMEDTLVEDGEVTFDEAADEVVQPVVDDTSYDDDSTDNDDSTDDESDDVTVSTDSLIIPTSSDDTIIGGTGSNDFFYDFSSNTIGGNDTLSDQGNDTDDAIVFEGIPENYSIILSKDPDDKNEMRIETFNTQDPTPTSYSNSINTINTPISDGIVGIENFILTTDDYYENNPEAIKYEGFYNIGQDDTDNMLQIITGTSESNSYSSTIDADSYWYRFSDYSNYYSGNNSDLGQIYPNYPYDATKLESRIYFTKDGNDTLSITDNTDTQYIANMGDGDDTVEMPYYNTIKEGSFFDGAAGTDTFVFYDGNDHIAFNNSNYDDALLDTSSAILSAAGTSALVNSIDNAYFKNFEKIQLGLGNDSAFLAGDPDNNIEILGESGDDAFTFNYALTKNITATGGNGTDTFNISTSPGTGNLTLQGGDGADTYNFNNSISSTISAVGGNGIDTFSFLSSNITGDVTVTGGDGDDVFKFNTVNNGTGLTINDYITTDDTFSFSSAAFQGNDGHVLVFGAVTGTEFMPDNTQTFINGNPQFFLHAFDQTNTVVNDLLDIDNDYWYYDTTDGNLYYDETADQEMSDAVTIAKVTDSTGNALDKTEILSSELDYFSTST